MWGWNFAAQRRQDLRYALRTIHSNRAFSAAAIISLVLGIGANTAMFSLLERCSCVPCRCTTRGTGCAERPLATAVAAGLLAATALAAALVPALRAARIDPLVALRYE